MDQHLPDDTQSDGASTPAKAAARQPIKLSPELLEWARQQFSEEEIVAGLLEIQATGGLALEDFLPELEKEFGLNE